MIGRTLASFSYLFGLAILVVGAGTWTGDVSMALAMVSTAVVVGISACYLLNQRKYDEDIF